MNELIFICIFAGLLFLTVVLLSRYNLKLGLAVIVPLTYIVYYVTVTKIPDYFGYPVPLNFVAMDQARFLYGQINGERITILVMEKGKPEPRLLSVPNNTGNQKILKQMQEQSKKGVPVLRKAKKKTTSKFSGNDIGIEGDIEMVPLKEQDILRKND